MNKSVRILIFTLSCAAVTGVSSAVAKPHDQKAVRNERPAGKVDKVDKHGNRVQPVPEPATMLVVGVGLGATMIGRAAKRRFGRRDNR